jgi:RecA-family ATPase
MTDREKTAREMAFIQTTMDKLPASPSAHELMATNFPPIPWIVPGFITTGLTIIAGAPKLGKSWLILGVAWALGIGGRVFGRIKVPECEVLFLALEDTNRRLKERLIKIGANGPSKLFMPTLWPKGGEGIIYLDAWMLKHPDTKAVFVDTLQRISGVEDSNSYQQTYDSAAALKKLADKYGIAIIVVHHTRKMATEDFLHSVSGSVGLTGAADTIITMTRPRGQDEGVLNITGRDVEENEYGIRFCPDIGTWELMDTVPETPSMRKVTK